jgi:hypothetical protein
MINEFMASSVAFSDDELTQISEMAKQRNFSDEDVSMALSELAMTPGAIDKPADFLRRMADRYARQVEKEDERVKAAERAVKREDERVKAAEQSLSDKLRNSYEQGRRDERDRLRPFWLCGVLVIMAVGIAVVYVMGAPGWIVIAASVLWVATAIQGLMWLRNRSEGPTGFILTTAATFVWTVLGDVLPNVFTR